MKALKIKTLPKYLKENIEVDITNLELNGNIRVEDVKLENYEILNSPRIPIASVTMTRQLKQEEAAAPAAKGAAPKAAALLPLLQKHLPPRNNLKKSIFVAPAFMWGHFFSKQCILLCQNSYLLVWEISAQNMPIPAIILALMCLIILWLNTGGLSIQTGWLMFQLSRYRGKITGLHKAFNLYELKWQGCEVLDG